MTETTKQTILDRLNEMELPTADENPELACVISCWLSEGGVLMVRKLPCGASQIDLFQRRKKRKK